MTDRTLVDTSFLYALYDTRDRHHARVEKLERELRHCHLVLAWPILYETINSRLDGLFRRSAHYAAHLSDLIRSARATLLDDSGYRERALHRSFEVWEDTNNNEKVSLVDRVLRLAIEDTALNIDSVLSLDGRDFRKLCRENNLRFELDYWT